MDNTAQRARVQPGGIVVLRLNASRITHAVLSGHLWLPFPCFSKEISGILHGYIYIYRYRLKLPTSHWNNAFMEGWAIVPG